MITEKEIQKFITNDMNSDKKKQARKGLAYYEGEHDIKNRRVFYYDADGNLREDFSRSNQKISHPFFTELIDQAVQYILSGDGFVKCEDEELQAELDSYFNNNEDFTAELGELLTGVMAKGFDFMYAYKNTEDKLSFDCADSLGVIEVAGKNVEDKNDYVIYYYSETIVDKKITRIQVWDDSKVYYFFQEEGGDIKRDPQREEQPHVIYQEDDKRYGVGLGFIPFFRIDNNKKQYGNLKTIKDLIDDYDLMASTLTNNLIDFDNPIYVVKGFEGDNLDELQQNLKTKKIVGMEDSDPGSGIDIQTVDVPYEARKVKLELDEKNIYRFGMGLNTAGLKDTSATTNIAIKAAYSLLDLKCFKLEIRLKQFLRKLVEIVLDEINERNETGYTISEVKFEFAHEIMSNAKENADIKLVEAQEKQVLISTLLDVSTQIDSETLLENICALLDLDFDEVKSKMVDDIDVVEGALEAVDTEEIKTVQEEAKEEVGVALNGAQTKSLLDIIAQYKTGTLNVNEAISIISISIGISEERARKLLHIES